MALSTVQTNNRLIKFLDEFTIEYFRDNVLDRFSGAGMTNIIRVINELKQGGDQINVPLIGQLNGTGVGAGQLVGNEEKLDDYGMRMWGDWERNAIAMKKNERHVDSADAFAQAKPLLSNWATGKKRDAQIQAFMALPSEAAPAGLGTDLGDVVNGIRYEVATAAQRNTWNADNSDRVLYGNATANYNATHATALANVDTTADLFTAGSLKLLKRVAKKARPKITPFKVEGGREFFVALSGSRTFYDLQASLDTVDKDARAREGRGMDNNPLFQDGDELYRGVIAVEVPEIDDFVDNVWTSLATAGASNVQVNPVFFCGQSALAHAVLQMPKPTFRKEDDYGFIESAGIEMANGFAKIFKKHPKTGTKLVQWGVVTGFFANSA